MDIRYTAYFVRAVVSTRKRKRTTSEPGSPLRRSIIGSARKAATNRTSIRYRNAVHSGSEEEATSDSESTTSASSSSSDRSSLSSISSTSSAANSAPKKEKERPAVKQTSQK